MSYRFNPQSAASRAIERRMQARLAIAAELGRRERRPGGPPVSDRFAALRDLVHRRQARRAAGEQSLETPPSAAVIAFNRLAFGPRPGDIDAFNALGSSDSQRLAAWIDQQLDPGSIDDSAAEARLGQSGFVTLEKSLPDLWLDHVVNYGNWQNHIRPLNEIELATFLRAIHSRRQLLEVMVDFWHNHFNVYSWKYPIPGTWVHTDRDAIRPHALGNFREMVEAVARTPSMLIYLDNKDSRVQDAIENYAREFLELHALGAMNYYGNIDPESVPTDANGVPLGFVEADVIAAGRCLTGWTIRDRSWDPDIGNTGEFLFHTPWHDQAPKTVLGTDLPANNGIEDGRSLFDVVCSHPGTATHIATKLARRLLGDAPPQSVIDTAAQVFAQHVASPDQIARTIRSIVLAPEFLSTWGDKVKRPLEVTVHAFRATASDIPFEVGETVTDYFLWMYYATGQQLFSWPPPNGYPDFKDVWNTSAPRVRTWRVANWCVQITNANGQHYFDVLSQTPAGTRSAYAIVDFWTERLYGRTPPPAEYDELVDFMAQGHNPSFDLPLDSDEETQERLRALVALMMMSPSFLLK